MQRDHKLGLALGVMLVGFAAALCFPRESPIETAAIELEDLAEVDSDIEQLPIRPYTSSDEPGTSSARDAEPRQIAVDAAGASFRKDAPTTSPDPVEPIRPTTVADVPEAFAREPSVEPVEHGSNDSSEPVAEAAHDPATAAPPSSLVELSSVAAEPVEAPAVQRYTVRNGDTLSRIAGRLLGKTSRFDEIFAANRDLLASPDDLRPGMVLVIPSEAADSEEIEVEPAPKEVSAAEETSEETSIERRVESDWEAGDDSPQNSEPPRGRFRPVGSRPFIPAQQEK